MDVHLSTLQPVFGDAEMIGVTPSKAPSGTPGLLHDVPELSGEHQSSLPGHHTGFHEHDVATHGRVEHAGSNTDSVVVGHLFGMHPRSTDQFADHFPGHLEAVYFPRSDLAGHLSTELAQLPLELPHTGLSSVFLNDR